MLISQLNSKITFQKNEIITDVIGNHKNKWADYYTCSAYVSGESGSESNIAANTFYDSEIVFTVRYCTRLSNADSTKLRIIFNGQSYNIKFIDHVNYKQHYLKFRCSRERK